MTTMTLNTNLNGIELYFDEKPADAIREAMKNLGFRWHAKKAMWWAKQTPERLALAEKLTAEDKPAKGKGKKATKKAEPKAQEPKAEPKSEPKAKKAPEVKLSELSDKLTYYVATVKGYETRKGYTFTATVGKTSVKLAVCKEKDSTWTVTECTTGIAVGGDYEKRYLALKSVNVNAVKEIAKMLKTEEYQKRAKALEKHIKKVSK